MSRGGLLATFLAMLVLYGLLVDGLLQSAAAEDAMAVHLAGQPARAAEAAEHRSKAEVFERLVALLNMSLMFLALYAGLGPLTGRYLDRGVLEVTEQLRSAERRSEAAHQELEEVQAALEKIHIDVEAIRDRERKAGEVEAERLVKLAHKEAKQIEDHAEQSIARELKHARESLVERIAGKSMEAAFADLRGELDDGIRANLQARMIDGVGA